MAINWDAVQKAKQRLGEVDLQAEIDHLRGKTPDKVNSPEQVDQRGQFMRSSLGDSTRAQGYLERVLLGNELQPVNYLARGVVAARSIARIDVRRGPDRTFAWGTGFLIAPRVLITNNHVLRGAEWAEHSTANFVYERDLEDRLGEFLVFRLRPDELFYTSTDLDFTVVAVEPQPRSGGARPLADFGWLPLLDVPGKAAEGEWLTIIQHPSGEPKQLCVRENRLIKRAADVLWYSTDTLGGSSGAPVFNNDWYVVALHHSGVPEERDGKVQATDGNYYDPDIISEDRVKWKANEGIRASRISHTLKTALPNDPLLRPMYAATPESARVGMGCRLTVEIIVSAPPGGAAAAAAPARGTGPVMPKREFTSSDCSNEGQPMTNGNHSVTIPVELTVQLDPATGSPTVTGAALAAALGGRESFTVEERERRKPPQAKFDVPFESDYDNRKGYQPGYLGGGAGNSVALPKLSKALEKSAVPLEGSKKYILDYHNYSLVMHAKRRFAIYTAANVNFGERYELSRPPDVWRTDPRIPLEAQVTNFLYASNQFDRGHLTRREDLEFGPTRLKALQSAADTCHWTNCTPQHAKFNQNKEIWQGIERHVLESSIVKKEFKAQVITGPVFDEGDPEYKEIQYPVSYWKVVAALNADDKLVATAFIASQAEVIDQFGIEAAPVDPFGPFKTFQVSIAEVERLTSLTFTFGGNGKSLSAIDPLAGDRGRAVARQRRRSRVVRGESATLAVADATDGKYHELVSLDDIVV